MHNTLASVKWDGRGSNPFDVFFRKPWIYKENQGKARKFKVFSLLQYQFFVYKINAELIKSTHVLLKVETKVETKLLLFLLIYAFK